MRPVYHRDHHRQPHRHHPELARGKGETDGDDNEVGRKITFSLNEG